MRLARAQVYLVAVRRLGQLGALENPRAVLDRKLLHEIAVRLRTTCDDRCAFCAGVQFLVGWSRAQWLPDDGWPEFSLAAAEAAILRKVQQAAAALDGLINYKLMAADGRLRSAYGRREKQILIGDVVSHRIRLCCQQRRLDRLTVKLVRIPSELAGQLACGSAGSIERLVRTCFTDLSLSLDALLMR